MRWKLTIEYDGMPFNGWQRQNIGISIQQTLEEAISQLCGEQVTFYCAGRTDKGVHALGQIVHFDLNYLFTPHALLSGMNAFLRQDFPIVVLDAMPVAGDFHARFHAIKREYIYRISNRSAPPALLRGRVLHVSRKLDWEAMQQGAKLFEGEYDFTSFRARLCQAKSPVKTIDYCQMLVPDQLLFPNELHLHVHARSFLYHQVRNMVGTLVKIGAGEWCSRDIVPIINARDRTQAGPTASPQGLYLSKIHYKA